VEKRRLSAFSTRTALLYKHWGVRSLSQGGIIHARESIESGGIDYVPADE
jgi:hypothetical protein